MATLNNEHKKKCFSCYKTTLKTQQTVDCLTCSNRFHAVSACIKSINSSIDNSTNTIDFCQHCLANSLPFQTLDDLDYELTVSNGNNISENEMDRLRHLKFNPFDANNNIALSENNANLDKSSKINCEYYLPSDLKIK